MGNVDKHWPWVVLVAAVVANVLSGGVVRSYGILFMDFRDRLETSSRETVIVAALALGMAGLIAPLAQGLSRKLGCFLVTLFGSFEMCLGFLISSFISKVYWHYITIGFLVGCGSGLVHVASVVAVLNVFTEKPVLMYALLSMAFPLGTFLFGFITRGLLDTYSYFGTFIILTAITANCIVCGLLFRPCKAKKSKLSGHQPSTYERMSTPVDDIDSNTDGATTTTDVEDVDLDEINKPAETETSMIHKPGYKQYDSVVGPTEEIVVSLDENVIRFSDYSVDDEVYVSSGDEEVTKPAAADKVTSEQPKEERSVRELPPDNTTTNSDKPVEEKTLSLIQSISDPRALCNCRVIVLILAIFLYSIGFGVPLIYYPDLSREHDITDFRAVWTLTVIGALSAMTVVVAEFSLQRLVSERPRTIVVLMAGSTLVGGVIAGLAHYYSTYEKLLLSAILFGLFSAPCRSLGISNNVIRELTAIDDPMPIFVWGNLISGAGFLIGLPVTGLLHDITGDYSWSFGFAGICFLLSAVLVVIVALQRRAHVRLVD